MKIAHKSLTYQVSVLSPQVAGIFNSSHVLQELAKKRVRYKPQKKPEVVKTLSLELLLSRRISRLRDGSLNCGRTDRGVWEGGSGGSDFMLDEGPKMTCV